MSDKLSHDDIESTLVFMRDVQARMVWNTYQGYLQAGFTQSQAFVLVQTYVLAQNPNGIHPPMGSGPDPDKPE